MDKIELKILGISAGHTAASYTLILEELNGERKLPVVIGSTEAQSIAVQIEGIKPIRPMTHDLMKSVLDGLDTTVKEVIISKLEEGIFYAELIVQNKDKILTFDARTSDAIALALRFGSAIFTYENILKEAGIILSDKESEQFTGGEPLTDDDDDDKNDLEDINEIMDEIKDSHDDLVDFTISDLEKMLENAINDENYILAARLRDEINNRK